MDYVFHFDVLRTYLQDFLKACGYTLRLSAVCILFATILGIICGALLTTKNKNVKRVLRVYVEFFRLTPYLVQLMFFYFGLPIAFGWKITPAQAGVLTLSLNGGAYAAETFRAGFQSIPLTQMQAGLSLGMTRPQVYCRVIIPQGIRIVLPSYISSVIEILKDTSMFSIIGVTEATGFIRYAASMTYRNFEFFTYLGIFYIMCAFTLGRLGKILEKHMNRGK